MPVREVTMMEASTQMGRGWGWRARLVEDEKERKVELKRIQM